VPPGSQATTSAGRLQPAETILPGVSEALRTVPRRGAGAARTAIECAPTLSRVSPRAAPQKKSSSSSSYEEKPQLALSRASQALLLTVQSAPHKRIRQIHQKECPAIMTRESKSWLSHPETPPSIPKGGTPIALDVVIYQFHDILHQAHDGIFAQHPATNIQ
jgi:hypothetical protein